MSKPWTVQARWIVPIAGAPIHNGCLTTTDGRIAAVGPARGFHADEDLGDVAILPGLCNAHTHLDLGGLRGLGRTNHQLLDWLRAVVAYRRAGQRNEWIAAIHAGLQECINFGTTLVGDIAHEGLSLPILQSSPLGGVVYRELIGLTAVRAAETQAAAEAWLNETPSSDRVRLGLSPHAPYSVRATLFDWALRQQVPKAIHIAETADESTLLTTHSGPLRTFLEELGAWDEAGLTPNLAAITKHPGLRGTALIHANYLRPESAGRPAGVVYCPRTHALFGHPPHPLSDYHAAGILVALGTDSLASNPDLSILEEMRFLHSRRPDLPPELILRMGTLHGACILGFVDRCGSLEVGKRADWIAIPCAAAGAERVYEDLLGSPVPLERVVIGGVRFA